MKENLFHYEKRAVKWNDTPNTDRVTQFKRKSAKRQSQQMLSRR